MKPSNRGIIFFAVAVMGMAALLPHRSSDAVETTASATQPEARSPSALTKSGKTPHLILTLACPTTLASGKANYVDVTIHNIGDETIEFAAFNPLKDVSFAVSRNGRPVPESLFYQSCRDQTYMPHGLVLFPLEKAEGMEVHVNLTRLFDLSIPGQYEITASWTGTLKTSGQKVSVSAAIAPTVVDDEPATRPNDVERRADDARFPLIPSGTNKN